VTYTHAKTFYFASHFIPNEKRAACYAVYAFCRYVDDIVDVAMERGDVTREDAIRLVEQWRSEVGKLYETNAGAPSNEETMVSRAVLRAWEDTLERYHIPRNLPEELIEGVLMDTTISRFDTFDELRDAIDLGIAMQLTNIIRDVKEDAERGRIYLPREELERFKVSEEEVLHHEWSDRFRALIAFQVERADRYYDSADKGIPYLDADSRLTVQLMSTNYRKILRVVEGMGLNVFERRASTSLWQKLSAIPAAWLAVRRM